MSKAEREEADARFEAVNERLDRLFAPQSPIGASLDTWRFSVKVEDALGARKFGDAGACTLDPDLTLATIRQAQPGATLDEIHLRRWILEYP
jgi:hypothetical protein